MRVFRRRPRSAADESSDHIFPFGLFHGLHLDFLLDRLVVLWGEFVDQGSDLFLVDFLGG